MEKEKEKQMPLPKYSYHFERFWREYPLKVNKGQALKAWEKLVQGEDETAVADMLVAHLVERKKSDAKWIEGKYIPHGASFLNGHRWLDDWPKVKPAAPSHKDATLAERHIPTDEEIARRREELRNLRRTLH